MKKGDPTAAKALFQARDAVESIPNAHAILERHANAGQRAGLLSADQRRHIRKMQIRQGCSSASSFSHGGPDGSCTAKVMIQDGKYLIGFAVQRMKARDVLKAFARACDEHLGERVVCSISRNLGGKRASANLQIHGIEDGLDQIAKLAGGRLEKKGDACAIVDPAGGPEPPPIDTQEEGRKLARTVGEALALLEKGQYATAMKSLTKPMDDETKEEILRAAEKKGFPLPPGTTKENLEEKLLEAAEKDGQEAPRYTSYLRAIQGMQPTFVDGGKKAYFELPPKAQHENAQQLYVVFILHSGRWYLDCVSAQPPEE
jgi:hypothetical protein